MRKVFHGYLVDSSGFVLSTKTGFKMTHLVNDKGYHSVQLIIDGKQKSIKVHRLVAHCWLGLVLESKLQVHHLDENPSNNCLHNLEIVAQGYHNHITNALKYPFDTSIVKQCRVCLVVKSRVDFYPLTSPNAYEAHSSWCRQCSCHPK